MRKLAPIDLELAVWIARLGSFTAAADRMCTTQPAVSARVKGMEQAMGLKLFERQGRGVQPTPQGREFVMRAEAVLRQLDDLSAGAGSATLSGIVRIGTVTTGLDALAAATIETARTMPLVQYRVEVERSARLLERLEAHKIDIAILGGTVDERRFRTRSLGFDRMLWVGSPGTLESRQDLPAQDRLRDLPIWSVHADAVERLPAHAALRQQGANLDRINVGGNSLAVARLVSAGAGIGLVSESLVRDELARGVLVALPDLPPWPAAEFFAATMPDTPSHIVDRVVETAVACSPFRKAALVH